MWEKIKGFFKSEPLDPTLEFGMAVLKFVHRIGMTPGLEYQANIMGASHKIGGVVTNLPDIQVNVLAFETDSMEPFQGFENPVTIQ